MCFGSHFNLRDWEIKEFTPELAGFTLLKANIWLQKREIPILVVLFRPTKEFFCAKRIGVCLQVSHWHFRWLTWVAGNWCWNILILSYFKIFFTFWAKFILPLIFNFNWSIAVVSNKTSVCSQDTQVWFLEGSFHLIFTLLPFVFYPWGISAYINQESPPST